MKNIRVRLSYILAALLILGSIFITPYYTSFADDPEDSAEISRAHFLGVQVDGNPITEGKDYTVEFKSVHITLLPAYLNTLSAGTHTLTVIYNDPATVDIPFVIQKAAPSPAPNTGDTTNYTIWIILMAVTLAIIIAAIVLLVHKRKRIRK